MGIKSEGEQRVKGRQRSVVKRRMDGRVERDVGQDLQVDLGPGDGLEEGGNHHQGVKPIRRMLGPIWRLSQ